MVNGAELVAALDETSKRVHDTAPVVARMPSGQLVEIDHVTVRDGRTVLVLARGSAPVRGSDEQ